MRTAMLHEAIKAFEQSLQLNPGHPAALTNLGFCFIDLKRFDQAISFFEDALARKANHFDALYGLARSHQELGHREKAIALWHRYIAEAPESPWKDRAKEHLELLEGPRARPRGFDKP
jgi:tetratricopeptide (TPR) repeat protein